MSKLLNVLIGFTAVLTVVLGVSRFSFGEDAAIKISDNKITEVGNKFCLISGEKIKAGKEHKVEYKGKVYNLCCSMCEKDFKKDPEAAIEKLETMVQDGGKEEGMTGMDSDGDDAAEEMPGMNQETK